MQLQATSAEASGSQECAANHPPRSCDGVLYCCQWSGIGPALRSFDLRRFC